MSAGVRPGPFTHRCRVPVRVGYPDTHAGSHNAGPTAPHPHRPGNSGRDDHTETLGPQADHSGPETADAPGHHETPDRECEAGGVLFNGRGNRRVQRPGLHVQGERYGEPAEVASVKKADLAKANRDLRADLLRLESNNRDLRADVLRLESNLRAVTRERDQMRDHWTPTPIPHPWTPRKPQCSLCDGTENDPRHKVPEWVPTLRTSWEGNPIEPVSDLHDSRCDGPECEGCR
jgi:hypothetical protein